MKNQKTSPSLIFFLIFSLGFFPLMGQETEVEERDYPNKEENAKCIVCHGHKSFYETNEELEETMLRNMYPSLIIDTVKFYDSNHWSFTCFDCHSYDYSEYPHPRITKFEYLPTCLDCHEGDEAVAQYNFEKISEEYEKSHHTQLTDTRYSCWSCHDPHSFKMTVREESDITKVVTHDNSMCLKCHSGVTSADLLMGTGLEPLIATHDWIPSTVNHFRHVRCLECHGDIVDDVMVAHDILPSDQAVNTCAECHSQDSRLLYSLYKYQIEEGEIKKGIFGNLNTSNVYVIGANRSPFLNWMSIIVFAGILLVIMIHVSFRIIKKK